MDKVGCSPWQKSHDRSCPRKETVTDQCKHGKYNYSPRPSGSYRKWTRVKHMVKWWNWVTEKGIPLDRINSRNSFQKRNWIHTNQWQQKLLKMKHRKTDDWKLSLMALEKITKGPLETQKRKRENRAEVTDKNSHICWKIMKLLIRKAHSSEAKWTKSELSYHIV